MRTKRTGMLAAALATALTTAASCTILLGEDKDFHQVNGTGGAASGTGGRTVAASSGASSGASSSAAPAAASSSSGAVGSSSGGGAGGSSSSAASSSSSGKTTSSAVSSSSASSAASSSSSSSSGSLPPVACSGSVCAAGQICCFNPAGPGDHCGTTGNCPMGYSQLDCSAPADCPGKTCCLDYMIMNAQAYYTGSSCQATCPSGSGFVACTNDPSVCPPGTQCTQSTLLGTGYMICTN